MLRDQSITSEKFSKKFSELKKRLDAKVEIHLDSEYHRQLKSYIVRLYMNTCLLEDFNEKVFNDLRDAEMSNLNRLQKLKNGTSYKKDKHKSKSQQEDWG